MSSPSRQSAIHRIKARRQFTVHLVLYLAMAAYFVTLWARSGAHDFWFVWPLLGWGIGLFAHASNLFGWQMPITEERIQREINRSI